MSGSSLRKLWREQKHRLKDVRDYFQLRRQYGENPEAVNAVLRAIFHPPKTVLFFPERPNRASVAYKLCALLGYGISTNPRRRFDAVVKWKDSTTFNPAELEKIPATNRRIINSASLDISKCAVNQAFAETFGYPLGVNPLEFHGKILEKSDRNAAHDGRILDGPLTKDQIRPGRTYQKAIDNSAHDGLVLDHRVPVINGVTPLVYLKYRPAETRFGNVNSLVKLEEPEKLFSPAELEKMASLARKMGIDYGELDVLRDKDGRIYVVDVNNTPHGPPNGLPETDCKTALGLMRGLFEQLLNGR